MRSILYLGTDPSRYKHTGALFHYPIIRTVPIEVLPQLPEYTHLLFTSPNAVRHWLSIGSIEGKVLLAIGSATAAALNAPALIAPFATQEGVVELIAGLEGVNLLWPRSKHARPVLTDYLTQNKVPFHTIDLYETVVQRLEPVPAIASFDEIVFTSPSTVHAFLQIFGSIPSGKKIVAIGPVTLLSLKNPLSGTIFSLNQGEFYG